MSSSAMSIIPSRGPVSYTHLDVYKRQWYHFSGTDQGYETGKRAIYRIQGEGKKWSEGVDGENGNYDFLIFNDVDFDHPERCV